MIEEYEPGYWNITPREKNLGKYAIKGFKQSEEYKRKRSIALKGKKNPFYGKKHTQETKKKMRLAHQKRGCKSQIKLYCKNCGREFEGYSYKLKNKWGSFCTKYCLSNFRKIQYKKEDSPSPFKMKHKVPKKWRDKLRLIHKGKKLSEEHKKKISLASKGKKLSDKTKEKIREAQKKLWQNVKYKKKTLKILKKSIAIKPTKLEKQIIEIIKEHNLPFNYTGNGKIWFKGKNTLFNPDFLSKNPKYIIEVFGNYWHRNTKGRDTDRIFAYAKYGYKTLIIWENEFKNPNNIVTKIKQFIKK